MGHLHLKRIWPVSYSFKCSMVPMPQNSRITCRKETYSGTGLSFVVSLTASPPMFIIPHIKFEDYN